MATSELDFPRDPRFAVKAGRILDLYERVWGGTPLKKNEFVISADEKQAFKLGNVVIALITFSI